MVDFSLRGESASDRSLCGECFLVFAGLPGFVVASAANAEAQLRTRSVAMSLVFIGAIGVGIDQRTGAEP